MIQTITLGRGKMTTRKFASLFALATIVVFGTGVAQVCAFGQGVSWLVQFDRTLGQLPESIAINKTGDIFVTLAPIHTIMKATVGGTASTFAALPQGTTQGITTDPPGNVYFFLMTRRPPRSKLVPFLTLFRYSRPQ